MDFSWDRSQADWSVIPRVREETLFGDGANVCRPKVLGHLCRGQGSVKDLAEVRDHATRYSLEDLGKKPSEPAALSGFSSFNFASTSGSAQLMSVKVFSPA